VKIIYDTDKSEIDRLVLIDNNGKECPYPCFSIQLYDGLGIIKIGRWGDQKKRGEIVKKWRALIAEEGKGNEKG
jgi:hypothetical protein